MFFLIQLTFAIEYYIKDFYSNNYIVSEEKKAMSPYFADTVPPDLFDIAEDNGKGIIKVLTSRFGRRENRLNENSVLEVARYLNTIIYFPYYQGNNQYVYLKKTAVDGRYLMMHDEKCVGYVKPQMVFELVPCNDEARVAYFKLIPPQDYVRSDEVDRQGSADRSDMGNYMANPTFTDV